MAGTSTAKTSSSSKKSGKGRKRRGVGVVAVSVELSERDFRDLNLAYQQARTFDRTITRKKFRSQLVSAAVSSRIDAMKSAAKL